MLVHHYLGNIARVELVRNALMTHAEQFPVILNQIVVNGVHCNDYLTVEQVEVLQLEVQSLTHVNPEDERQAKCLRYFEEQLHELATAALQVRKPISF